MSRRLQILMATYNSGRYLAPQLDSILAQDFPDFEILIRDGGSTDGTQEIIDRYRQKFPEKIVFAGQKRAGACENFSELLNISDGDLIMFSDHDDIWMPDKISSLLTKFGEMEKRYGSSTPLLLFSDAMVTDDRLNVISNSLMKYQHLDPSALTINRLILQNVPSGNVMLFNRALADLAMPIPETAVMHDHWLALAAAAFGKIEFLDRPTVYYRQHGNNVFGASQYSAMSFWRRLKQGRRKIRERFDRNITQAVAFGQRYHDLSAKDKEMLSALNEWGKLGFWGKRRIILKYRLKKSGFLRNLGTFLIV